MEMNKKNQEGIINCKFRINFYIRWIVSWMNEMAALFALPSGVSDKLG
jgi:hypothetical protein